MVCRGARIACCIRRLSLCIAHEARVFARRARSVGAGAERGRRRPYRHGPCSSGCRITRGTTSIEFTASIVRQLALCMVTVPSSNFPSQFCQSDSRPPLANSGRKYCASRPGAAFFAARSQAALRGRCAPGAAERQFLLVSAHSVAPRATDATRPARR